MSIEQRVPKFIKRNVPKLRFAWAMTRFFIGRSGLHEMGWFKSAWKEAAVNQKKEPIPWITYSAVYFLEGSVPKDATVFEYGSGNSTLWWAKKARLVVAAEYDEYWAKKMEKDLPGNASIFFKSLEDGFEKSILEQKRKFDIVFIDGRERVKSAINSVGKLSKSGVIIWDNTNRERYSKGIKYLEKAGFKRLDFYGMMPIDNRASLTTVFYRKDNILNI